MKTKIKLVLKSGSEILKNTTFKIEPIRRNFHTTSADILQGITDNEGVAHLELIPQWYPYRLTEPTKKISISFFVPEVEGFEVDFDDLVIGHYDLDPFSPSGQLYRETIKTNIELKKKLAEALNQNKNLIGDAAILALTNKFKEVTQILEATKALIASMQQATHLETLKRVNETLTQVALINGDIALMAKEFLVAREMGMIQLGEHYLWIDEQDHLRIKRGKPANEYDGKQIGD